MATIRAEDETRQVVALLGGRKVFSGKIRSSSDLKQALREGFPFASFEAVLEALEFSSGNLARLVGTDQPG